MIKSKPNQILECRVNVDKLTLSWKSDVNKFHSIVVTLEEFSIYYPSLADVRPLNPHEVNPYTFEKFLHLHKYSTNTQLFFILSSFKLITVAAHPYPALTCTYPWSVTPWRQKTERKSRHFQTLLHHDPDHYMTNTVWISCIMKLCQI